MPKPQRKRLRRFHVTADTDRSHGPLLRGARVSERPHRWTANAVLQAQVLASEIAS